MHSFMHIFIPVRHILLHNIRYTLKLAGNCVVCSEAAARYKCPTCSSGYCSIKCYKQHKLSCTKPELKDSQTLTTTTPTLTENNQFEKIFKDPRVQKILQSPSLKFHLQAIYTLLTDQSVTKELSAEGRRAVALKKLRELRVGGREENEQVEEFVQLIVNLMEKGG